MAVLQEANLVTQIGNGDGYTGAWGKANVITKVGMAVRSCWPRAMRT
ncbi:hypothetical protein H2136_06295 [Aeromonas hydrophila]|uniref:Uncharacterized protein n=1 Tax=Aeromonas hydrophila TaxID=644 RepID=A0A926FN83_AERHY|nr:hypothetical protein [Aeromonas hydrophila]